MSALGHRASSGLRARLAAGVIVAVGLLGCDTATEPSLGVVIVAPDRVAAQNDRTFMSVSVVNLGAEPIGVESCNDTPVIRWAIRSDGDWLEGPELICPYSPLDYRIFQARESQTLQVPVGFLPHQLRLTIRLSGGKTVSRIVIVE